MRRERTESEGAMQELLWRRTAAFEGEASDLYFQIARLKSVQKAALDAGTLRARQILYQHSLQLDGQDSSISWRGSEPGIETQEAEQQFVQAIPVDQFPAQYE